MDLTRREAAGRCRRRIFPKAANEMGIGAQPSARIRAKAVSSVVNLRHFLAYIVPWVKIEPDFPVQVAMKSVVRVKRKNWSFGRRCSGALDLRSRALLLSTANQLML